MVATELVYSKETPIMPTKKHGVIVETPTEARQAEPGPSILLMLTVNHPSGCGSWRRLVGVLPNLTGVRLDSWGTEAQQANY
jgi:hypothetical protein